MYANQSHVYHPVDSQVSIKPEYRNRVPADTGKILSANLVGTTMVYEVCFGTARKTLTGSTRDSIPLGASVQSVTVYADQALNLCLDDGTGDATRLDALDTNGLSDVLFHPGGNAGVPYIQERHFTVLWVEIEDGTGTASVKAVPGKGF